MTHFMGEVVEKNWREKVDDITPNRKSLHCNHVTLALTDVVDEVELTGDSQRFPFVSRSSPPPDDVIGTGAADDEEDDEMAAAWVFMCLVSLLDCAHA